MANECSQAQAPYRFIPIGNRVVPGPVAFEDISHGKPREGGYSGVVKVEWTAHTPICVGQPDEGGVSLPFQLGEGGPHALPGPSLKGMIRSVVEIATFSHLGPINAHHRYSYRDFKDEYRRKVPSDLVTAGWLRWRKDHWELAPVKILEGLNNKQGIYKIEMKLIEQRLGAYGWGQKTLRDKRRQIFQWNGQKLERVFFQPREREHDWLVDEISVNKDSICAYEGYLVCANSVAPRMVKRYEAIVPPPDDQAWSPMEEEAMRNLSFLHSKPGTKSIVPQGVWDYWLQVTGWPEPFTNTARPANGDFVLPGIPVFYKGELENRNDTSGRLFFMGFSRAIKAPYEYSLGEVAARTVDPGGAFVGAYSIPRLRGQIDLAWAMFGDVEGTMTGQGRQARRGGDEDREALKGRVAFGFAKAEVGTYLPGTAQTTVMMAPRASYWPFYLKDSEKPHKSASYNCEKAILAGRKRYPVSQDIRELPKRNNDPKQNTRVAFLGPAGQTLPRFTGEIRFHNLHPVELGALLWALCLGNPVGTANLRHSLGRGKGFGFGQLACRLTELQARENFTAYAKGLEGVESFIKDFIDYMDKMLKEAGYSFEFKDSPAVKALWAMADPEKAKGQRLGQMGLTQFRDCKKPDTTLCYKEQQPKDWASLHIPSGAVKQT